MSNFFFAVIVALSLSTDMVAGDKDKNDNASYLQAAERFAKSEIVEQKNCITCHTIGKSGGTVGPILNQVSNRRPLDWLRKWLKDPNATKPGTKMPNFQFSDAELDNALSYLKDMKRTVESEKILAANPEPMKAGEALFKAYDCYACHRIGDQGRFIGPNLTWVGLRKPPEWERIWLKDPPAYKPGTFMPNFHLSPAEIAALTAFLHSLQGQHNDAGRKWESITAFILDARPRERGRLVAERLACWSCHGENLAGGIKNPNAKPDGFVPAINSAYLDFSEEELQEKILNGSMPEKLVPDGESPPFACPPWKAALNDAELADLLAYLESIAPESAKWEFK
ncbi:c-type cytochrome [candidate division KSB1 bacterium]|nr:c-type cytochrome [candidate division KSB1 bacterium]